MKILKKIFFQKKEENETSLQKINPKNYKKSLKEYNELQQTEKKLQSQIDELIQEKIVLQIKINELEQSSIRCENCDILDEQIKIYLQDKKNFLQRVSNLKQEIKIYQSNIKNQPNKIEDDEILQPNEPLPEPAKYFIMNNKFYIIDNNNDLYTLTKCKKFEEYKKKNAQYDKGQEELLLKFINSYSKEK